MEINQQYQLCQNLLSHYTENFGKADATLLAFDDHEAFAIFVNAMRTALQRCNLRPQYIWFRSQEKTFLLLVTHRYGDVDNSELLQYLKKLAKHYNTQPDILESWTMDEKNLPIIGPEIVDTVCGMVDLSAPRIPNRQRRYSCSLT